MKVGWLNELWPNQIVQYSAATTEDTVGKYVTTQNWCRAKTSSLQKQGDGTDRLFKKRAEVRVVRDTASCIYFLCFSFLFKHL